MRSDARVLSEDEEELALNMVIEGHSMANVLKRLGFSDSKRFWEYRQRNPDFAKRLERARDAGCEHLEDRILSVADDYGDHHQARIHMEAMCKVLAYRNPQRYGNRVDLNITQQVDIGGSLTRMQSALDAAYRDVTQISAPEKPNDSDDLW